MNRQRVEHWDDERADGNSLIVTLKAGWRFAYSDVIHVMGFDTKREANSAVKSAVKCACEDCKKEQP